MGKFVFKQSVASSVVKTVAKPLAKTAIKSGAEYAGERLGKKAAEKSSDLKMKRLRGLKQKNNSNYSNKNGRRNYKYIDIVSINIW